jgi:hypothetical protein
MNYYKTNLELLNDNDREQPILTQYQRAWLWCRKFWQFSLYYGDYLASLHSRKR